MRGGFGDSTDRYTSFLLFFKLNHVFFSVTWGRFAAELRCPLQSRFVTEVGTLGDHLRSRMAGIQLEKQKLHIAV